MKNALAVNMFMEVTQAQRDVLLHTNRTAEHMFNWVYDTLNSENISLQQYNLLIKIHDMSPQEQMGYIIHQDTLYPVPRKVKKYQLTDKGWEQRKLFTPVRSRPSSYKKDK